MVKYIFKLLVEVKTDDGEPVYCRDSLKRVIECYESWGTQGNLKFKVINIDLERSKFKNK